MLHAHHAAPPPHLCMTVAVETPMGHYLEGLVRADADLDGTFTLFDPETGERFRVNGWTSHVSVIE